MLKKAIQIWEEFKISKLKYYFSIMLLYMKLHLLPPYYPDLSVWCL